MTEMMVGVLLGMFSVTMVSPLNKFAGFYQTLS